MTPGSRYSLINDISMFGNYQMGNNYGNYSNMYNPFMMNGCCNGPSNASIWGGLLGSLVVSIGASAIDHSINNQKENSPENIQANLNTNQSNIDAELKKLGKGVTESNYRTYNAEDEKWYTDGKSAIEGMKTDAQTVITAKTNQIASLNTELQYIQAELNATPCTLSDEDKISKNKRAEEIRQEVKKLQDEIDAKNKILNETVPQKESELSNKLETRKAEVSEIIKNIDKLVDEKRKLTAKYNERILDKADGTILNRATENQVETKIKNGDNNFNSREINRIIHTFSNTKDPEQKLKYARVIVNLTNLKGSDLEAQKIVKKWLQEQPQA